MEKAAVLLSGEDDLVHGPLRGAVVGKAFFALALATAYPAFAGHVSPVIITVA